MANHRAPIPSDSAKPTSDAWEGLAALTAKTTTERDEAIAKCASLSAEVDRLAAEGETLRARIRGLLEQAAQQESLANAAIADLNARVGVLQCEAGEGNGEPVEWYTIAQHATDDYRVLKLTTPGVPPRAVAGERSMDPVEAEHRFRAEIADLFDKIAGRR